MQFTNPEFEAAYGLASQLPDSEKAEIVFSGRSNVGKSSLLNKLFNRKSLARVSSVPGKTITVNFYDVDGVHFVDLPGYGYAKAPRKEIERWSKMIDAFFSSGRDIRLVVQLIDMRHKPTVQDYQMLDFLQAQEFPFVIALTKADKLKPMQRKAREAVIQEELAAYEALAVAFSAENGEGVPELKELIQKTIETV